MRASDGSDAHMCGLRFYAEWRMHIVFAQNIGYPQLRITDVLADTKQTNELVDGHISIFELTGSKGPLELRDGHPDRGLRLALEMFGVLLRGEVDHGGTGICISHKHDPHDATGVRRSYHGAACQELGPTSWLDHDRLLIPAARAEVVNLVIFPANRTPDARFSVTAFELLNET
jgi:hypothetical protein